MNDRTASLIDTNVLIHAQADDEHSAECLRLLAALQRGSVRARLEPLVLHELTYVLPRYVKQFSRADVATYCRAVLSWPGIEGEIDLMTDAVRRWAATPGLGFVDAYLAAVATRHNCAVYTKNVDDLAGQGVAVPLTLPSSPLP